MAQAGSSSLCCSKQHEHSQRNASSLITPRELQARQVVSMLRMLSYKNFSGFLGMFDSKLVDQIGPEGVTTTFRVQPGLVTDGYLNCGVILALFDEVSSWAFVGADRKLRPGVSVTLNAEIVHWVREGEEVTIKCKAAKVGETLGFAEMFMYDSKGREVAHGRHVKFLVMGRGWNIAMQPWAFPFVYRIISFLHPDQKRRKEYIDGKSSSYHEETRQFETRSGDLDLLFEIKDVVIEGGGSQRLPFGTPSSTGPSAAAAAANQQAAPLKARASFVVIPSVCNTFGSMHGGAVATLVERFAGVVWSQAARWAGLNEVAPTRARNINIDFMSPCPKCAHLTLEAEAVYPLYEPPSSSSNSIDQEASTVTFPPLWEAHQDPPPSLPSSFRIRFMDVKKNRCLIKSTVSFPVHTPSVTTSYSSSSRLHGRSKL